MYNKRFPTFESAFQFLKNRWHIDMSNKVDRFIADWLFCNNNLDNYIDFQEALRVADNHHFEALVFDDSHNDLAHGLPVDSQLFFNFD